ncbi:Tautomerase/MIF superfamily [Mycena rosella]|uniref:L-dopachrome isomerase n=1 Tax=Mycena rosella TaxID=1033263 RepID=A0AAD7GC48_MYCRO|nr:Tautomerase/MIF superfamily [Mycena rosella]
MPSLELTVNVPIPNDTEFALEFSKVAAKALGKPEATVAVTTSVNKALAFAGTLEPAFVLTVISLDNLNPEANEKYSAALSEFFQSKLGIPNDRGYITFHDPGKGYLGFKGTTIETLLAKA